MKSKEELQRIGQWMAALRRATSAGQEPIDDKALAQYTTWLAADFPLSVFTAESVKWMAEQSQYFPKWVVLKAGLTDWHTAHPDVPRIAFRPSNALAERIEELTDEGAWHRRVREERAAAREDWSDPHKVAALANRIGEDHPMRFRLGRMLGALVGKHAPQNLAYLPPEWHP